LAVAFGLLWCLYGFEWTMPHSNDATRFVDDMTSQLRKQDPNAANGLDKLKQTREHRALAATLLMAYREKGLAGVKELADTSANNKTLCNLEIASLATDANLLPTAQDREAFITSHATTVRLLNDDPAGEAVPEYVEYLKDAAKDPQTWRAVRDDPVAVLVWREVSDPALRDFYLQNRDWLAEILCQFTVDPNKPSDGITGLVGIAKRFPRLVKQAVGHDPGDLDLGVLAFQLFLTFGDTIDQCVTKLHLPLQEVLEVLFANGGTTRDLLRQGRDAHSMADNLARLHDRHPEAWEAARHYPLVLRLYEDVPDDAGIVLKEHQHDDIASFLYASYESEIRPATKAVRYFGDVGIYVLNKYAEDRRFRKLLSDPSIGARAIPYVVRFGDSGIDQLGSNRAFLDKYFDADGKPKEKEWWQGVPIAGAPINVFRNWTNGIPNEWSELGWAALDVADGALLVVSLGGSAVVEESGEVITQQAAKQTARRAGQTAAKKAVNGARQAAKRAATDESATLLQRTVRFIPRAAAPAIRVAKWGSLTLSNGGRRIAQATRAARTSWKAVRPSVRTWVYRGLLGAGLFVTVSKRTIPATEKIASDIQNWGQQLPDKILKQITDPILKAIEQFGDVNLPRVQIQHWVTFIAPLVVCGLIAYVFRPWKRRRLHHA
ncbi:MAG TPA: hypothetical protein VMR25_12170, partial [Planctomycetaceae bacterium]|nr:hypothetical protein [Planctomycetaceae bacterium]